MFAKKQCVMLQRTVVPRPTDHKDILSRAGGMNSVDCSSKIPSAQSFLPCKGKCYIPACETDSPASSISWSRDQPPMSASMRSLSSDAASFDEIAYTYISPSLVHTIPESRAHLQRHPCGSGVVSVPECSRTKAVREQRRPKHTVRRGFTTTWLAKDYLTVRSLENDHKSN